MIGDSSTKHKKVFCILPSDALVNQKVDEFNKTFELMQNGPKCLAVTYSMQENYKNFYNQIAIFCMTYSKLYSLIKYDDGCEKHLKCVGLILFDEIHEISDTFKGGKIEASILRVSTFFQNDPIRVVAVSATMSNIHEFGLWLKADAYQFGEQFRPLPLLTFVETYKLNDIKDHFNMFKKLAKDNLSKIILEKNVLKLPTLVFCPLNTVTSAVCAGLVEIGLEFFGERINSHYPKNLQDNELVNRVEDKELQALLREYGIGYYHNDLSNEDKSTLELLLVESKIYILCCTGDLSVGVNFPVALVVVFTTIKYNPKEVDKFVQLENYKIIQMGGRAGRFGFGFNFGQLVILTEEKEKDSYLNVSNLPICGNFLEFLTEFLFHLIAGTNIKHTITSISAYLKQSIFTNQSNLIEELEVRERIANLIKYKLIFESIDTFELTRLGRLIKQHGIAYKSYTRFYNDLTNEQWDANRFVDHEIIDGHGILKSNGDYINLVIFQKIHLKKKNKYKINKIEGECVGPFYRIW